MKRPSRGNSDSLFNERERAKKRREALLDEKAFERVQNERIGFTKVGNRFGRAVTRYIGFGQGNLIYFKAPEGGKRLGYYYFSPGTRCKILNIEDEDLNEDILESGMQCIRITGLRKKNGKERGPLFLLFDTKNEANTWERAFNYSKREGTNREETKIFDIEDDGEEEEGDMDINTFNTNRKTNRKTTGKNKNMLINATNPDDNNDSGSSKTKLGEENTISKKSNNNNDNNNNNKDTSNNYSESKMKVSFKDIGKNFFKSNKTNLKPNKYTEDDNVNENDSLEPFDLKQHNDNNDDMIIGEPGDKPIDHNSTLNGMIDRDSVLRNQRVVLQTARYLQQKRSYPKDLFSAKISKMEVEKLMNDFAFSRHVELDSHKVNVVCRAMLIGLQNIGSTIVPKEVYGMYEASYTSMVSSLDTTRNKTKTKQQNLRMVKDLIDMMSQSNVRLIREVSSVVRKFCYIHRPWEVAVRPARRFDDTRRNLAPRFARILILNQHKENYDEAPPAAAVYLMIALIQNHNAIFGYTSNVGDDTNNAASDSTDDIENIGKQEDSSNKVKGEEDMGNADKKKRDQESTKNIPGEEVEEFDYEKHAPSTTNNGAIDLPDATDTSNRNNVMTNKLSANARKDTKIVANNKKYRNYNIDYDTEIENEISKDENVIKENNEKLAAQLKALEEKKDARTIALERTVQKYVNKIKSHKTEVQDKYMLQDWQDRVDASKKLLAKHLKQIEAEHLKEQGALREKRVSDALEAAKVLKADKEDLNLVDLRRTLKNVKMMWVQARSTNLRAINGSIGEGNNESLDVKNAMRKSDKALGDIEKNVGIMRDRHFKKIQNRKVTNSDQVLTNDISRTLIEILHENIKLRSQLNAYTEALLLPTLEKQAEFQQDYEDRTAGLEYGD